MLLHPKKHSTKRGRSSTDCQEIMGSIKNYSRWGLVPATNMKLQKKVDMSDGERTVQTWRPNPLPSANQGSNVKSSYINRHTDPQQEKKTVIYVLSFLDCSLMGNAPKKKYIYIYRYKLYIYIWTHATHVLFMFQ